MRRILGWTLGLGLVVAAVMAPSLASAQATDDAAPELTLAVAPLIVSPNPASVGENITIAPDPSPDFFFCNDTEVEVSVTAADGSEVAFDQLVGDANGAWQSTIEAGALPPGTYTAHGTCVIVGPGDCTDGTTPAPSSTCVPCDDGFTTAVACDVCTDGTTAVPGTCPTGGLDLPPLPPRVDYQSTTFVINAAATPITRGPAFTG